MSRYAAIDIGSNSIRMLAAEVSSSQSITVLAADRQVVRLGKTVFREGKLAASEIELACQVLGRMVEQYRKQDIAGVRAVEPRLCGTRRIATNFWRGPRPLSGIRWKSSRDWKKPA
jgi:hypothetical protein